MNKPQKIVVAFFLIAIVIITLLFVYYLNITRNPLNLPDNSSVVLYYSFTCPHCKIVEEFMKNNSIESKINITQKEVSMNTNNANELIAVGKFCKLQKDYVGAVPLLYADKACYLGDKEIIDFLKAKTGVK